MSLHRVGLTKLAKDPFMLRTIVKEANQNLAVYASVTKNGAVHERDQVELI